MRVDRLFEVKSPTAAQLWLAMVTKQLQYPTTQELAAHSYSRTKLGMRLQHCRFSLSRLISWKVVTLKGGEIAKIAWLRAVPGYGPGSVRQVTTVVIVIQLATEVKVPTLGILVYGRDAADQVSAWNL